MASKILKRAPVKHIKDRRSKLLKRTSPVKSGKGFSSIVATSIKTCRRRIVKIFTKFARIGGTPIKKSPKKQGNRIIPGDSPRRSLQFDGLLPQSNKRTIFLDLDETLVHSKPGPPIHKYDFIVRPEIDGVEVEFYVTKRPFVDELLETLKQKFELVIFTAGVEEYASKVLEKLDGKEAIRHRLYRDSCRIVDEKYYVKDLESTGRDLSRAAIVDDNPNSYSLQPENGIPISPFTGDMGDVELLRLMDFFNGRADCYVDMRDAVKLIKNYYV